MRAIVTADLHYGMSKTCNAGVLSFLHTLEDLGHFDLMVICGDVAETIHLNGNSIGKNHRQVFRTIKKLDIDHIAFCAGNHDIWASGESNSWAIYTKTLREIAAEWGVTYLDFENLYLGDVAVTGTMGHYDYSFATKGLVVKGIPVEEKHYSNKTPPTCTAPVWSDANYINWEYSDVEACKKICGNFELRYTEAIARSDNIIAVTHSVPIMEMNGHQEKADPASNFLNAFSGSARLGEIISKGSATEKSIQAFSGHTHFAIAPEFIGGIKFCNIGSDYGNPQYHIVET